MAGDYKFWGNPSIYLINGSNCKLNPYIDDQDPTRYQPYNIGNFRTNVADMPDIDDIDDIDDIIYWPIAISILRF